MALYPDVQRKAQEEIANVIGCDRLPSFSDRESLPYVNALALEVLRWHSVTPTGVPHRVMEDNIHDGYFIPAGTVVIANILYVDNICCFHLTVSVKWLTIRKFTTALWRSIQIGFFLTARAGSNLTRGILHLDLEEGACT